MQRRSFGLFSGSMLYSQSFLQRPHSVQLLRSNRRKKAETRLSDEKITPSGHKTRHQGRRTKKMVTRKTPVIDNFRTFGHSIAWPAATWPAILGPAASMAPAGQTRQMNNGCPRAIEVGDCQDGRPQHDEAEMPRPGRQLEFRRRDLGGEVLKPPEGAGPATEQAADQRPEEDQQADRDERNHVQCAGVGHHADGAAEGRQWAGVAMEDRGADAVKAGADGGQPDRQEGGLNPEAIRLQVLRKHRRTWFSWPWAPRLLSTCCVR